MLTTSQATLTCPLTLLPFTDPQILLEDGFTYEKSAIINWLKEKPTKSPMVGDIKSATLLPNWAVTKSLVCPITHEPFKEPYFCREDLQTYEKEAIIKWFETKVKENLEIENQASISIRSPVYGTQLESLTLYPNKVLFQSGGIPKEQGPLKYNYSNFLSDKFKKDAKCITDEEIRQLVLKYSQGDKSLGEKIHERRKALGLEVNKTFWRGIDLSNLDLSNLLLKNLQQKGSLLKDNNFSNTIFIDCDLPRCRFINCNLNKTTFINCDFKGEEVSFFNSDMTEAVIEPKSRYIERGSTWAPIMDSKGFRAELKSRGGLNTDTVIFKY